MSEIECDEVLASRAIQKLKKLKWLEIKEYHEQAWKVFRSPSGETYQVSSLVELTALFSTAEVSLNGTEDDKATEKKVATKI